MTKWIVKLDYFGTAGVECKGICTPIRITEDFIPSPRGTDFLLLPISQYEQDFLEITFRECSFILIEPLVCVPLARSPEFICAIKDNFVSG